jgi:hypothetical protein
MLYASQESKIDIMSKNLKKKKDYSGTYFIDEFKRIQGEVKYYNSRKILIKTENYVNNCPHGKCWTIEKNEAGSNEEWFFYGNPVGYGKEGKEEFEAKMKIDNIRVRLKEKTNRLKKKQNERKKN